MTIDRIGPNFLDNTTTFGDQIGTGIVALNDGRFFLSWLDAPQQKLKGQFFDSAGIQIGTPMRSW